MIKRENLSETMKSFLKQLPDPRYSNNSTIFAEFLVDGQNVKFMAQKVKGLLGMTWKIEPVEKDLLK